MGKKWYRSKSIISAILKAAAGIITSIALMVSGEITFADFLPGAITTVWAIVDMIIRYGTDSPIYGSRLYWLDKMK